MIRTSFNDAWEARPKVNPFAELGGHAAPYRPVTLPHDAMIERARDAAVPEGAASGYFPGGGYEYRKSFSVPAEHRGKRIVVEFEGVYRDAMVYLNGTFAGQRPYGYSQFAVEADQLLRYGAENEIRVEARSGQDSRWYTGAGLYRNTWLIVGDPVHLALDGVRITTPDIDADRAVVEVATLVENDTRSIRTVELHTEVHGTGPAGQDTTRVTIAPGQPAVVRQRVYVRQPALWSVDSPNLYRCAVTLRDGDTDLDQGATTFGIRKLQLDPEHGLRLNGVPVKLRGACIHHDNGLLGAATIDRAEQRRVQLLKSAGFNAIRSSHHPLSTAMLDACDREGMLVLDETFDMWTSNKNPFDYALAFPTWWERDVEAMVAKDFNHPSVVMYSIGNEIPEVGSAAGALLGRRIAEKIRSLDPTRYLTNAVNGLLAVMSELRTLMPPQEGERGINSLLAGMDEAMNAVGSSELVTERTAESFGVLDVAGMNYMESRYLPDRERFPNRIILGTETFPTHIAELWRLVEENPQVIGDFTWTGWDYLGEAGIGRAQYATPDGPPPALAAPYPWLTAGCGDLDLTGHRRPASYYREIVFGLRAEPYVAVWRPERHGQVFAGTPWAWSDTVASWSWPGFEGAPVTVEIYSAADEVELLVNGVSLGRAPAGPKARHRAEFETRYEPGELVAVAYRDGEETGRCALASAVGPVRIHATADRTDLRADGTDLAYLDLTLADAEGNLHNTADRVVRVELSGPAVLQGFGSANPAPEQPFAAAEQHTYDGRALAVVRPTGPGAIRVTFKTTDCDDVSLSLVAT